MTRNKETASTSVSFVPTAEENYRALCAQLDLPGSASKFILRHAAWYAVENLTADSAVDVAQHCERTACEGIKKYGRVRPQETFILPAEWNDVIAS